MDKSIELLADGGYQELHILYANSGMPIKRHKNQKLSTEEKMYNRNLSSSRILVENVNRRIKRFKIMGERYRNKRQRHALRMTIICALHNMDLACV